TTPFGAARGATSGAWPNAMDKGFVGGTKDNTGLTHLGAREYDPTIGRFISVDPIQDLADPQQWNGYAYANNSPVTSSDPSGLWAKDPDLDDQFGHAKKGTGKKTNHLPHPGGRGKTVFHTGLESLCLNPFICKLPPAPKPVYHEFNPNHQVMCLARPCYAGSPVMECASYLDCSNVYPYLEDYACSRSVTCILRGLNDIIALALLIGAPALSASRAAGTLPRLLADTAMTPAAALALPPEMALTFAGARHTPTVLAQDTVLYRAGVAGMPLGQWFSAGRPVSVVQTRIDKAIPPVWPGGQKAPLDTGYGVLIPRGTVVYTGKVADQGGWYMGGTNQIVVVKPWEIPGVEVVSSWPLK
ncbi:RHS repeat domain-containing protein, partial [Rhizomonospora bruguierae]|uniref:RHS repeat domain-containing protein n=1 Tax=Rhizomonospora bruguierae TaxID=1581705 RepID=UPI001BD0C730